MNIFGIDESKLPKLPDLPAKYSELTPYQRREIRMRYITLQNNLCCYCNKSLSGKPPTVVLLQPVNKALFPDSFFNYPIHLHHHHDTDFTIGAIHAYCNAVSWQYDGI